MSALDRIGKTAVKTGAKKTQKTAATTTPEIRTAVDEFIQLKARIKADEAALADKETQIIDHVRPQQDSEAFAHRFSKSFDVAGNTGSVLYNTSDRFSIPQAEDAQTAIKDLVGDLYNEFFKLTPHLSIKAEVLKDEALLERILTACETAGLDLGTIFEKTEKVEAVDGLDEKQYRLGTATKLDQFRTLIRQNKPALK